MADELSVTPDDVTVIAGDTHGIDLHRLLRQPGGPGGRQRRRTGRLGAKGVGESGTLPVAAALASAVEDAIGRPVRRVPLSPTRLYSLMTAADSPAR